MSLIMGRDSYNKVFALVDCNNFYCSCERAFNPSLLKKPVIVLSNNDGCIIARSEEVKALGVKMGAPFFKYKDVLLKNNVTIFSSNYQLYGDMSYRVMTLLKEFSFETEIYSIDEAFLRLDHLPEENLEDYALKIRRAIYKATGIPVSIGIARTKTLAKLANHIAKKKTMTGVFDLRDKAMQDKALAKFPVEDLWGVGRRYSLKLKAFGLHHALALRNADAKWIREHFTVMGEKMHQELNGISCYDFQEVKPRKNIISSRSFSTRLTAYDDIAEAVANYVARACEKLRAQKGKARSLCVFIQSSPFSQTEAHYKNSHSVYFDIPTADTGFLIKRAKESLTKIYLPRIHYQKAGVILQDIVPEEMIQYNLFTKQEDERRKALMKMMDSVNRSFGRKSLGFLAQGTSHPWANRSKYHSPRYTTNWDELVSVKAG